MDTEFGREPPDPVPLRPAEAPPGARGSLMLTARPHLTQVVSPAGSEKGWGT